MPIALDPKSTFPYVLEDDRSAPEGEQTVFQLRGLTVAEEASVSDSMILATAGADELSFRAGTHQLTVLRHGLRGWSGFRDSEGKEVSFEITKGHPRHITDGERDTISILDSTTMLTGGTYGSSLLTDGGT